MNVQVIHVKTMVVALTNLMDTNAIVYLAMKEQVVKLVSCNFSANFNGLDRLI